jgi:hypothetical protein
MTHRCGGPTAGVAQKSDSLRQLISQSVASAHKRSTRRCPVVLTLAAPKIKITKQSQFFFAAGSSTDYTDCTDGTLND